MWEVCRIEWTDGKLREFWLYSDEHDYESGVNPNDVILMQDTGLKDKNGKEIYEGDIIEFNKGGVDEMRGVVEFIVDFPDAGFELPASGYYQDEAEVIGNVHQHPELLNQ